MKWGDGSAFFTHLLQRPGELMCVKPLEQWQIVRFLCVEPSRSLCILTIITCRVPQRLEHLPPTLALLWPGADSRELGPCLEQCPCTACAQRNAAVFFLRTVSCTTNHSSPEDFKALHSLQLDSLHLSASCPKFLFLDKTGH